MGAHGRQSPTPPPVVMFLLGRATMSVRLATLTVGILAIATSAGAQSAEAPSAGAALRTILFRGEPISRGEGPGATGALSENSSAALYGLLLGETTTFPTGTSAGGFSWTFDDTLHVPVRRSRSFGPMFAERPFTTGKGKLNVGAAFQHTTFSSVGGRSLTDLETSIVYESGDVYRGTSSLDVQLDRTIVSATYGLHNKVDVAAIVPFGSSRVSGFALRYQLQYGVEEIKRTERSGSSFGIGDILVRTKVALIASDSFDAAAAVDIRLPTGDPEKLLGTGFTQARVMFIGGTTFGSVNPHINLGYTFGGEGMKFDPDSWWEGVSVDPELINRQPSEEFNYTAGVDFAVTARLTIAGDIIGRVVKNSAGMEFVTRSAVDTRQIVLEVTPGTVHKLLGAVGAKVSVGGAWLLTGTVLFPLNDAGIKPAVTPVIGFERAF